MQLQMLVHANFRQILLCNLLISTNGTLCFSINSVAVTCGHCSAKVLKHSTSKSLGNFYCEVALGNATYL